IQIIKMESTPVHPEFFVHIKVLKCFYIMHQIGPSSKFVYATALQYMLQRHAKVKVPLSSVCNPTGAEALQMISSYLYCIYGYMAVTEIKGNLFVASMAPESSETQIESELEDLSMDDSIHIIDSIS